MGGWAEAREVDGWGGTDVGGWGGKHKPNKLGGVNLVGVGVGVFLVVLEENNNFM